MMMYNDLLPSHDEGLIYDVMAKIRNSSISSNHSTIIDSTAPNNETREFLLGNEDGHDRKLVIVMDVDRKILEERAKLAGKSEILKAYDGFWEEPSHSHPVFKFRNDDQAQFETSFYLLNEYLRKEYERHSSTFRNMLRLGRRKKQDAF